MSILDRFCAPLCDFIAETTGSAGILHELERTNLFLLPLDDEGRWFRFHHLFAAVARSELQIEHADQVRSLHVRAGQWFRDHGHIDEAVTQYLAAGNTSDAALLVQANWLLYVDSGRMSTVLGWLDALGTPSIATDPAAGVTAAWMAALSGDEPALNEHLHALEESSDYGPLPDGTRSVESAVALIGGCSVSAARWRCWQARSVPSNWRPTVAHRITRSPRCLWATPITSREPRPRRDIAGERIPQRRRPGDHPRAGPVGQSLVESERGQPERSRELAEQAMEIVDGNGMHSMQQTSLAFTALGQAQAAAGRITDAMATLEHGLALRRKNPALTPWQTIHHLIVMSRVALEARQLPLAQELLAETAQRMDRYHDGMRAMRARLAAVQEAMRSRLAASAKSEPLTSRELDVLRHLQGSSSLSQIAGELYLSPNTVKTHTKALYRKLGAGSRSDAVHIARQRLLI